MPIVFVSPGNKNLKELKYLIPAFDFVFTSNDEACQDLCDDITEEIPCDHMFTSEKLDYEFCSKKSWNIVMSKFSVGTGAVLVIATKEYFNTLIPEFIQDEWQTLSFDQKYLI
jgi:hypothetical protein